MSEVNVSEDIDLPYELEFDESSNTLYGIVKPPPPPPPKDPSDLDSPAPPKIYKPAPNITGFSLRKHIEDLGFHEFLFPNTSINNLVKGIKDKKVGKYALAERQDGRIEIRFSGDRSTATAKIFRAWGGKLLSQQQVLEEITRSKVYQKRLIKNALKRLCTHCREDIEEVFARALKPIAGKDASLQPLIESQQTKERDADSDKPIDQRNVFEFTVIDMGIPLLKKIPATPGTHGQDVFGKEILAKAGNDIPFTTPYEGVEPSCEDENILVAAIKGHPVFTKTGVKVDPILTLKSVDIHSGNIDYDGSVAVKENIESGFEVKASGDIFVKGQVAKSSLKAGGDIIVKGGILGEEDESEINSSIVCGGMLKAKFLNHAKIESKNKVIVEEYIMQSHVTAKDMIMVGQEKGRGCIIGGYCSSETGIKVKTLGSEAYVTTKVNVGFKEEEYEELSKLNKEKERRNHELEQLAIILNRLKTSDKVTRIGKTKLNKIPKVHQAVSNLQKHIKHLEAEIFRIKTEKDMHKELKIHVSNYVYPNAILSISGVTWHCEEQLSRQTVSKEGEQLKFSSLER